MPHSQHTTQSEYAGLAHDSLRALQQLSPAGLISTALGTVDDPWVREVFGRDKNRCGEFVGFYDLVGPDEETPWPAAVVRVTRTPWRSDQEPRIGFVALYLNEEGGWEAVSMDAIDERRRRQPEPGDTD